MVKDNNTMYYTQTTGVIDGWRSLTVNEYDLFMLCYIRVWHNTVQETQLHNAILWKNSHQADTPHKGLHNVTPAQSQWSQH